MLQSTGTKGSALATGNVVYIGLHAEIKNTMCKGIEYEFLHDTFYCDRGDTGRQHYRRRVCADGSRGAKLRNVRDRGNCRDRSAAK
jgi:hypothetical protein